MWRACAHLLLLPLLLRRVIHLPVCLLLLLRNRTRLSLLRLAPLQEPDEPVMALVVVLEFCVGVGERARIWGRECVHVCMCARLCVYVGSVGYLASTWTSESPSSYEMSSFPVCAGACVRVSEGRLGLYV